MQHHELPTKNFTMKVDINHCNDCVDKAMIKLKKMDGLHSVKYDTAKEMLKVSGSIDPQILIQKFEKWGRKAELYSFDKDSLHIHNVKCKNCCSSKRKTHGVKIKDLESSSDSSDDCDSENCDSHAPKKVSKSISWQHPCPAESSLKEESPMNKQSAKKSKKFFGGWFGKKDKAAKPSGNKNNEGIALVKSPAATKWHFPRPSMPAFGVPRPLVYPPPYGDQRLYRMNQYPPMMFSRPMRPYYGYGLITPPQYYQPRPPPTMNPMIHYTSYSDNHYP